MQELQRTLSDGGSVELIKSGRRWDVIRIHPDMHTEPDMHRGLLWGDALDKYALILGADVMERI